MNQITRKLFATIFALILSVVVVVSVSYAWMTLSNTPVAEGIQITIGGGHTILVSADVSVEVDGTVYHYPAGFRDTLNFNQYRQYDYLKNLSSLAPVSTADGIHWFIPEYYNVLDEEVKNGDAVVGQIKPVTDFTLDTYLEYANLTADEDDKAESGHYIYIDFWVVSPGSDYDLRVSRGNDSGGSFLLELMSPEEADEDGDGVKESYILKLSDGHAAASARIGFLVNQDQIIDNTMLYYQTSYGYSDLYTKLRGSYQEPDSKSMWYSSEYRFTIFEPNGDLHPNGQNGTYIVTDPVGWDGSAAVIQNIKDRLTVQLANTWKMGNNSSGVTLEQAFKTATMNQKYDSVEEVKTSFYQDYLQNQVMPYVNTGKFIQSTAGLYGYSTDGFVTSEELDSLNKAGATDDTVIASLEKNVPQRIRMFIWLEGQDVDCVDTADALDFALSIELAGSNQ